MQFHVIRHIIRFASLFLAGLCLVSCDQGGTVDGKVSDARARNDGPAIWVAEDVDSKLYLFGTVHLLPSDLDWQKQDMRDVFAEAGTVFFEIDTGDKAQLEAVVLTQALGFYQDGRRLSDHLDSYQLKLLEAASHNGDITFGSLDSMKPWLASEFLTIAAAGKAGLSPTLAADEGLKSLAARQGKNIRYLDTIETQIRSAADQPDFVQMALLSDTLSGFNGLGETLTAVVRHWSVGQTDYIAREIVGAVKLRSPDLYQSLFADKNTAWSRELIRFLEGSGTGFAAVGIGHYLGEESLIKKLREQGYQVSRYYAFQGEPVIKPAFSLDP